MMKIINEELNDPERHNIALEVAQKITGKRNQHETAVVVGAKGAGKSWAALSLAYETSKYIAEIRGGKPEDYFSIKNVAIITKKNVIRVLKEEMKQYSVVIFDDIGVGWSNRDFQSKFNKVMNGIFQIFRTKNIFLIMSVPQKDYIDKLPREGLNYFIEVVESHFDKGFVEVKIKRIKKSAQDGYITHPFLIRNGKKYVRHLIMTAPEYLTTPYEIERKAVEKESSDAGIRDLEALELEHENGPELNKAIKKTDVIRLPALNLHEAGYSQREIGKMLGCSATLIGNIIHGDK